MCIRLGQPREKCPVFQLASTGSELNKVSLSLRLILWMTKDIIIHIVSAAQLGALSVLSCSIRDITRTAVATIAMLVFVWP